MCRITKPDWSVDEQWETLHKWEWFHREQWRPHFRRQKAGKWGGSCGAFKKILGDSADKLALDCSCGLGLKTIVLKEMGVNVVGSDGCALAVRHARELAELEEHQIEFFTSRWEDLPNCTSHRFDGIFNDALSWTLTREEFESSLRGFLGVLKEGGVFVFMGAARGEHPEDRAALIEELWRRKPRFNIEWSYRKGTTQCTSILVRERGDDFVEEHHLFLIVEDGKQRLEAATMRQPVYWSWPRLETMFRKTGFSGLETRTFANMARGGKALLLNVATK